MKVTTDKSDNELIAEFMGWRRQEVGEYSKVSYWRPEKDKRKRGTFMGYYDSLGFDEKWQCLMPVVDEIVELGDDMLDEFLLESGEPLPTIFFTLKEVHEFCVKVIKWYNANKL